MGELQLARPIAIRAGEAATHVPEQLGFEKVLGQPGAVQRHERPIGARRAAMDALRDEIFPVPLSPVINTLALLLAARSTLAIKARIAGLSLTRRVGSMSNPAGGVRMPQAKQLVTRILTVKCLVSGNV